MRTIAKLNVFVFIFYYEFDYKICIFVIKRTLYFDYYPDSGQNGAVIRFNHT